MEISGIQTIWDCWTLINCRQFTISMLVNFLPKLGCIYIIKNMIRQLTLICSGLYFVFNFGLLGVMQSRKWISTFINEEQQDTNPLIIYFGLADYILSLFNMSLSASLVIGLHYKTRKLIRLGIIIIGSELIKVNSFMF